MTSPTVMTKMQEDNKGPSKQFNSSMVQVVFLNACPLVAPYRG